MDLAACEPRRRGRIRASGAPAVPPPMLPPEVIVGIRPEHARLWRDDAGLIGPIEGRVAYVEMLGRETFIGIDAADDATFTAHAEPDAVVAQGDRVHFGLERDRLYLFDPQTERAIARV